MPFKSKSQERYMFSQHPKIAQEFADKTPDMKALPEHTANGKTISIAHQLGINPDVAMKWDKQLPNHVKSPVLNADSGTMVPGQAQFAGDNIKNEQNGAGVKAILSPSEVVISREEVPGLLKTIRQQQYLAGGPTDPKMSKVENELDKSVNQMAKEDNIQHDWKGSTIGSAGVGMPKLPMPTRMNQSDMIFHSPTFKHNAIHFAKGNTTPSGFPEPQESDNPAPGEEDPGHINQITQGLAGPIAAASGIEGLANLPEALKGLGETGEFTLGKAPQSAEELKALAGKLKKGDVVSLPKGSAEYVGVQKGIPDEPGMPGLPDTHLFNAVGADLPEGAIKGSTYSPETMEKFGMFKNPDMTLQSTKISATPDVTPSAPTNLPNKGMQSLTTPEEQDAIRRWLQLNSNKGGK